MGDKTYAIDPAGNPVELLPNQLEGAAASNFKPISKAEAAQAQGARVSEERVNQNYGTVGKALAGVGGGLTLGLGPAAAVGLGADPGDIEALQETGAYKAGDIAGMIAPAFLSGGESLAAEGAVTGRGAVARALGLTPAGMLGRAGTAAESFAGRLLPEAGVLGKLARPSFQMAARGAIEGALVNLAHTASDSIIQDKPLTWAAIAASGVDGALLGGLAGGALGAVGAGLGTTADAVGGFAGGRGGTTSAAKVARRLGAGSKELSAMGEDAGTEALRPFAEGAGKELETGVIGSVKRYADVIKAGGASIGSDTPAVLRAAKQTAADAQTTSSGVIHTLDNEAPNMVPDIGRVEGRIHTDLQVKYGGSEDIAYKKVLASLERPAPKPPTSPKYRPVGNAPKDTYTEFNKRLADEYNSSLDTFDEALKEHNATPKLRFGDAGTWKSWEDSRAQLAGFVKNSSGLEQDVYRTALNAMDSEIRMSMEAASDSIGKPGLSQTYHGALMTKSIADELTDMIGVKAGKESLVNPLHLNGGDVGSMAYSTMFGHPFGGAVIVAGKHIVQHLQRKIEPWMAESAYRSMLGASAGAATTSVGNRMSGAVKKFLSTAPRLAAEASSSSHKPVDGINYSRKNYESSLAATEKLISDTHRTKVQEFAAQLAQMGHPQMADEAAQQYQRATEYLNYNKPMSTKLKQAGQMGKIPTPVGLTTKEMKFLRIDRAIKNPLSLLDDLENGNLSREAVKAVKYVYPPLHEDLVFRAAQEMLAVKEEGKFVPADKLAMLGTVLDSPIDSKLEKPYIDAIQSALATNAQPQPGDKSAPAPAPVISETSTYQTPLQNSIQG